MVTPKLTEVFRIVESTVVTEPLVGQDEGTWEIPFKFWPHLKGKGRWAAGRDADVRAILQQSVQRTIETMMEESEPSDGDRVRLPDITCCGHIRACRLDPEKIAMPRGDRRYDSSKLANDMDGGKIDLVPIEVGASGPNGPYHILDGHHRVRGAIMAKVPVFSLVCWVDTTGKPGTVSFEVDL